jgi:hypothetical protein
MGSFAKRIIGALVCNISMIGLATAAPAGAHSTFDIESHGWWIEKRAGEPPEGRHIHVEVPFPLHQVISGTITLPITVALHNQPGRVSMIRVQVTDGKYNVKTQVSLSCPDHDCEWTVPVKVDTTKVPTDGSYEFRITANIVAKDAAFGRRFYQSTRWHATIANGKPVAPRKSGWHARSPGAAGWYEGVSYTNVLCGPKGYDLIASPISGTVSLPCKFDGQTAVAEMDANSHAHHRGTVLLDSSGGSKTISFDSRKFSNGRHQLFLRTCKTISNGTGCGQLVLPLEIAN